MQKSMLIGQWKMSDMQSPLMENHMEGFSEEQKKMVASLMADTIVYYSFAFMEDGTYEYKAPLMDIEIKKTGRWEMDEEGKKFTIISKEGKKTGYNITELSETTITLKNNDDTMSFVKA